MQTSFQAMADQWAEEFGIRAALGIGLNRGEAVVGTAGIGRMASGAGGGLACSAGAESMARGKWPPPSMPPPTRLRLRRWLLPLLRMRSMQRRPLCVLLPML